VITTIFYYKVLLSVRGLFSIFVNQDFFLNK
jgi:hypothetical protein